MQSELNADRPRSTPDLPEASAAAPRANRSRWRSDLWVVGAVTLASYFIAAALQLQESLSHRLARLESWQADEIPLSLTVLACGLAWYALRRRREVQRQLALREQAEARVADLLEHNRELARRLISLQESERLALARELHDELGQSCTAIRIETACLRHCAAGDRASMLEAADRADAAAQGLYQLVRDLLRRLRPANLDTLGLGAALQELCESWETRTGVSCILRVEGACDALGDALDITIYRVVQEALTNVARHARASRVRVTLACLAAARVSLSVQDDGQGMDVGIATRGLGLLGAVERAAGVGGELQVRSAPGAGVTITLRIPLPQAAAPAASAAAVGTQLKTPVFEEAA
jgi:two-component system sensor histidine kinase UhpB